MIVICLFLSMDTIQINNNMDVMVL